MGSFQVWNVEVKIPKCLLQHGGKIALKVKKRLDELREDLEEIEPECLYVHRKKSRIEVRVYLLRA